MDTSIEVKNVSKIYKLYDKPIDKVKEALSLTKKKRYQEFYALRDISFDVKKGETFGIVGTNGSGKSTLLKILTGVVKANSGETAVRGKISALLELGAGFNPEYTGIQNIYLNGTTMGYTREEMKVKIPQIIEFADIGDFINQPVKNYSSGMFARLAFAVAINVEPEVLIVDEALSVGDVFFQNKCYRKFEELKKKDVTILFVSHDIHTVKQMCSRVLWIEQGVQQMVGDSVEVCNAYANKVTKNGSRNDIESNEGLKYSIKKIEMSDYPPISYSNESELSEKLEVLSCFISDESGNIVNDCEIYNTYTVSVVFRAYQDIAKCIPGFIVETIKGLWVINCNTAICGERREISLKKDETYKVDFTFQMPGMITGEYIMATAISEGTIKEFEVLTWLYGVQRIHLINNRNNSALIEVDSDVKVYSDRIMEE